MTWDEIAAPPIPDSFVTEASLYHGFGVLKRQSYRGVVWAR